MRIDIRSFILGAIVGACAIVYRASVSVARDKVKEELESKKEEGIEKIEVQMKNKNDKK
jgi:hypothetical protein